MRAGQDIAPLLPELMPGLQVGVGGRAGRGALCVCVCVRVCMCVHTYKRACVFWGGQVGVSMGLCACVCLSVDV
jgi:hypothetical protein